ncbi:hypothetical protein [Dyadobacter fermentans]|uniref:Uncharacterized protein n=1 Tax=Dyadobacter fermentans (strain ATCC 700827 / DSM 18053 / CIP 107007 / KCTC 52180 / NS114) TaxID=471854 RepID=C6W686_DYAFD|nr:hypothetical protein [Dyadobacter fermentans]ACT92566.1 hypothetical protein Dfer_1318 [Dyadobacter fermentans DSM 18053]
MKTAQLLLFLAVICTACSKDSSDPKVLFDETDPRLDAARFYFVDQSYYAVQYKYNGDGLLDSETQLLTNGQPLLTTTYKYKEQFLTEQRISGNPKVTAFTYQYIKDTLVSVDYHDFQLPPDHLHFTRSYSYPEKGIVKIVEQDVLTKTTQHIYLFIRDGNIVKTKVLDPVTDQVKEETAFEYDQHPNPYSGLTGKGDYMKFYSANNVTVERTLFRNSASVNQEVRYEYEYSPGGWPLKKHQVLGGSKKLLEQEYIYKGR